MAVNSYNKTKMEVFSKLWIGDDHSFRCPECGGQLIVIQAEPLESYDTPATKYETVIECSSCSYHARAESYTILGSVKDFDMEHIEVSGWSESGSRFVYKYEHLVDYNLLSKLRKTGDIVEFLIVDDYVIQVIG
ncbi:MAG TPA: hypothetical protein ENI44_02160 [Thermoplasmatales archaeon]|nr:hypothetical protein [Thermoplasmatales archaeon]